jgi:hypothetical protein
MIYNGSKIKSLKTGRPYVIQCKIFYNDFNIKPLLSYFSNISSYACGHFIIIKWLTSYFIIFITMYLLEECSKIFNFLLIIYYFIIIFWICELRRSKPRGKKETWPMGKCMVSHGRSILEGPSLCLRG